MEKLPECSTTIPSPPGVSGSCPKLPEVLRTAIAKVTSTNLIAVPSFDLEIVQVPIMDHGMMYPMYMQRNTKSGKMRLISFYSLDDNRQEWIAEKAQNIQLNESLILKVLQKFMSLSQNPQQKATIQKDLMKINMSQVEIVKANAALERAKNARDDTLLSLFP